MSFKRTKLFTIMAVLPFTAVAEVFVLPEVVVKASKSNLPPMPLNASKLDADSLQGLLPATSDTARLLGSVPGISLVGAGGVSGLPSIRGLADDRLRIKVDGMDLISACANHMNPALSYIAPSSVENIAVFAGIAPVSVAGDSIGGSILVTSSAPEFAKPGQAALLKGQVGAFYRSNGNAKGGNLSATIAGEKLSMTYSGSTAESDNYKAAKVFKLAEAVPAIRARDKVGHWLDGDEVASSYYKSTNQSLGFALRHENHQVELKLGWQDIPAQGFPNQRMDMTANDSTQVNLRYKGQYDWGKLEARVFDEKIRHSMQFGKDKWYWYGGAANVPGMPMETEGNNSGASIKADIVLSARDLLRIGSEAQIYRLDDWWPPSPPSMMMSPNTFWNIHNGKRDRLAIFAEWEARWNPQWMSQLGVRGETVKMDAGAVQGYNAIYNADATAFNARDRKRTDHNLDLTALARYTPDSTKTLEFGYAQKTRSPNLYERYAWSKTGMAMLMVNMAGDGNGYVGNLDLQPEVAHTLSFTADWHDAASHKWGLKITPYYTYVQDYIDAKRCPGSVVDMVTTCGGAANATATNNFVYLQFVNQSAHLYGLDISGHLPLAENAYGKFTASGVVNYVRGENRSTGGNLYNIMPPNVKLALEQRFGNWSNTLEAQFVDAKTKLSQVRNEIKTDGYSLLNLRSSYTWKQLRLDFGVENLLDTHYTLPLGGAYTGQGKTMSGTGVASPTWGVAVPGMGRSIYAGMNVKF